MSDNNEKERKSPPRVPVRRARREFCFLCGIPILGHHGLCHRAECTGALINRTIVDKGTDKSKEKTDPWNFQQQDEGKATPGPNPGGSQVAGRGRRESLLSKQIREYDLQQAALQSGPAQGTGQSEEPPAVAAGLPPAPLAQDPGQSPQPGLAFTLPPTPLAEDAGPSLTPAVAASLPPAPLAQDESPSQAAPAEDPTTTGSGVNPRIPRSEPIPIPIIGYYRNECISALVTPEPVPNANVSDPEHVIFFPNSPLVVPSATEHVPSSTEHVTSAPKHTK